MTMTGSVGIALATAVTLPQLVSLSPDPSSFQVSGPGTVFAAVLDLTVSPQGQVKTCQAMLSNGIGSANANVCKRFTAAHFAPAVGSDGAAADGRLELPFTAPAAAGGGPKFSDVGLTVDHLPPGTPIHPHVTLALDVDKDGHVKGCEVAKTSGSAALDAAACRSGAAQVNLKPLKDAAGDPTRSVQSLTVSFAAYAKLVLQTDASFTRLGMAGPYFPDRAARINVGGYAVLACTAALKGSLEECKIDEEAPLGFGFGAAAMTMAGTKWMQVVPGAPGAVLVRVDFSPPGSAIRR